MRALITTLLAALCVAVGLTSPVSADTWRNPDRDDHRQSDRGENRQDDNRRGDHRRDHRESPQRISQFVPLQLPKGRSANVDQVYMNVGGKVLAVSARDGVARSNQNRLDWSRAPGVGHLAQHRYRRRDFRPELLLGEAYFERGVVWLDLSEEGRRSRFERVEFLNQDFAYRLTARPERDRDIAVPNRPPGREIGKVFRGDDGVLLVLVRPFIVTD
jgi:hypothetical protein